MKVELKNGSGIKKNLVSDYTMDDLNYTKPTSTDYDEEFCWLATKCVDVGGTTHIRDRTTNAWVAVSKDTRAKAKLYAEWAGVQQTENGEICITLAIIDEYLKRGIVCLAEVIYAPKCADFVLFKGKKRLNMYKDTRLVGDSDDIVATEELLKIIRGSLCGVRGEIGLGEMLEEISNGKTVFAWIIQWLACRYQNPGYFTQTNLWLVGHERGIGKGSLLAIMRYCLGAEQVQKVTPSEVTRGWDDFLVGAQLVEWDEFRGQNMNMFDYSDYIKRITGNDILQLATRGQGVADHPNIAMHIFCTNNETPIAVDKHDRQNTFVQTHTGDTWKARVKALWDKDNNLADDRVASGFAALLGLVEVDYGFVTTKFDTELYGELVEQFSSTVEGWLQDGDIDAGWVQRGTDVAVINGSYSDFTRKHYKAQPMDLRAFKKEMKKLGRMKDVVGKIKVDGAWKSIKQVKMCD